MIIVVMSYRLQFLTVKTKLAEMVVLALKDLTTAKEVTFSCARPMLNQLS